MRKVIFALLVSAAPLLAQQPPQPGQPGMRPEAGPRDPFSENLFPPDMVMMNQGMLGLRDTQRTQIQQEMSKAQNLFTDTQWKMAAENEKLERLLHQDAVDETAVLAQVDQILALEREVKRAHIALLVRIRNALTPEQRDKLARMRH